MTRRAQRASLIAFFDRKWEPLLSVIPANAGLRRQDAEANSEAGPEGALREAGSNPAS